MKTRQPKRSRLQVEGLEGRAVPSVSFGPPPSETGVPFQVLIDPGLGPVLPDLNGFNESAQALPHAYGAPLIINL